VHIGFFQQFFDISLLIFILYYALFCIQALQVAVESNERFEVLQHRLLRHPRDPVGFLNMK
jgi:hypothetical protein